MASSGDRARVVVIGGGVIGSACADELARGGSHVTLLERAELAAAASGRNHGLLLSPLDPALVPMARATAAAYDELAADSPVSLGLDARPIGFLLVAGDDQSERDSGKEEAEAAAECGVEVDQLDPSAIARLESGLASGLSEGWLLHDGRRLDPAALTVALALRARANGAEIRTRTAARALIEGPNGVAGVMTDEGPADADVVVMAAGPWAASLLRPLGLHLPITGARGWLVGLRPDGRPIQRLVGRAGWHVPPHTEPMPPTRAGDVAAGPARSDLGTLIQPNQDGTLLVGGSRQAVVTPEPEDPTVPGRLLAEAIRLVPSIAEASVLEARWAIRPMTPDGRPLIGRLAPGLFVTGGHGSVGVILAAGTGQLLAAMVLDESLPFDPQPFSPQRFRNRH